MNVFEGRCSGDRFAGPEIMPSSASLDSLSGSLWGASRFPGSPDACRGAASHCEAEGSAPPADAASSYEIVLACNLLDLGNGFSLAKKRQKTEKSHDKADSAARVEEQGVATRGIPQGEHAQTECQNHPGSVRYPHHAFPELNMRAGLIGRSHE